MIPRASNLLALAITFASTGLLAPAAAQTVQRNQEWDPEYQPRRTAWGHPNLQGNWTNATMTSLERRPDTPPVYTWAQVDRIEGREHDRIVRGYEPSDPNRPPPEAGNIGAYNQVYFDRGEQLATVNGEVRTSLITFPSNGRLPALSPEGQRRKNEYDAFRAQFGDFDHPELRPLVERCVVYYASSRTGTMGPPMSPTAGYNNNITIVQNQDHVLIRAEMIHDTRIIRLGEPQRLPSHIRPWFGDSWGHWEGNTLVVETTNVHPDQGFNESFDKVPYSEDYRVVERFTQVDDDTILYEFEIDDPRTFSEPWGGQIPYEKFDQPILDYDCHEGNYALGNVLSGARYQERQGPGGRR
jgi:hypothetical protein